MDYPRGRTRSPSPRGEGPMDDYRDDYEPGFRKRRRSPSPLPMRADSYVPAYGPRGGYDYPRRGEYGPEYRLPAYEYRDSRYDAYEPYPRFDYRAPLPNSYMHAQPYNTAPRLTAPLDLPYQVSMRYFTDWTRDVNPSLADDKPAVAESFRKYRQAYSHKQTVKFYDENRTLAWFKEKYSPAQEFEDSRKARKDKGAAGRVDEFIKDLEDGKYDQISFDAAEKPPAENGTNGEEKKDETAEEKPEGEAEKKPEPKSEDIPETVELPHDEYQLFIKSISPDVALSELEQHCQKVEGFQYITLSSPDVSKRLSRVGWAKFAAETDMKAAAEQLAELTIHGTTVQFVANEPRGPRKVHSALGVSNTPARIQKDLQQVRDVCKTMESALGDERGLAAIQKRLDEVILPPLKTDTDTEMTDVQPEAENGDEPKPKPLSPQAAKRSLDLHLQYLRSVFNTCYYCMAVCDFQDELLRKCPKHVRQPASEETEPQNEGEESKIHKNKRAEETWTRNLDDKVSLIVNRETIDPREFGGENIDVERTNSCTPHVQFVEEGKFRCLKCSKLFKAMGFVEKHIVNKHNEVIAERLENVKYLNNFVLDPSHVEPPIHNEAEYNAANGIRKDNNRNANGFSSSSDRRSDRKRTRGRSPPPLDPRLSPPPPPKGAKLDPRAGRSLATYQDLDTTPSGGAEDIVLDY